MHIKALLVALVLTLCTAAQAQQNPTQEQRLRQHVGYLAADSLQGRNGGSPYANKAAHYIANQFAEMGLKPWPTIGDEYFWHFFPYGDNDNFNFIDVIGYIEGSNPSLRNEYIVVGAHYDHLGVRHGEVYNGADDNASGTATIIEVARSLVQQQQVLGRSIVIVAFDGEELGLLGSKALANHLDSAGLLADCRLMMSIDMVGWLDKGGPLTIAGTAALQNADRIFEVSNKSLPDPINLRCRSYDKSIMGSTDHEPFAKHGVPGFYVSTGLKSPYHKPGDDADLINYQGLDRITTFFTQALVTLSRESELVNTGRFSLRFRKQLPLFEMGLNGSLGSSHMRFPGAAFTGRSSVACGAGMSLQLNARRISFITGAEYSLSNAKIPLEADPFNTSMRLSEQRLLVPALLQFRLVNDVANAVYFNLGAYGSYLLNHSYRDDDCIYNYTPATMHYGIQWTIGLRVANIVVEDVLRFQVSDAFEPGGNPAAPNARLNQALFRIAYIF